MDNKTDKAKLRGSLPVLPTPFFKSNIDFESLERLFGYIFPHLEGCTVAGSTGEAVSLSFEERVALMRFSAQKLPSGKILVAGLTHTNLAEMIRLAQAAREAGVHAGLVPAPYYFPNSFTMVLEFFRELSRSCDLPLVFYDNPLYTKTWMSAEEVVALIDACPTLVAVKMTDHDLAKIPAIRAARPVPVFAGDDVTAFRSVLLGDGSMIIAPALFPASYQHVAALIASGCEKEALAMFAREVLPFIHLFGPGDEVQATKAAYKHLGIFRSDEVRLPLLQCTPERKREVIMAFELCRESACGQAAPAEKAIPRNALA